MSNYINSISKKINKKEKGNRKQMKRIEDRRKNEERGILYIGIIIMTISVIIILLSIWFNMYYTQAQANEDAKKLYSMFDNFLMCIGTTIFAVGAGTALYSYFDFVNYVRNKLKEVIIDYDFTDILSDEKKKMLARKLQKELLHQNEGNDLYDFVQEEVLSLANKAYYEEFTLNISCKRKGKEIHKIICKDYVINCNIEKDFDIVANNEFGIKYKESCKKNPAENIKLCINGIVFEETDYKPKEEKTDDEVYNRKCKYVLNDSAREKIEREVINDSWDGRYIVKSETTTVVADDDVTFSFRLYHPCKKTTFVFTYNPDEFEVMEDIFVFKDTEINEGAKEIFVRHNNGSIYVKIGNWILPGDGITFLLSPAKKK